MNKSSAALILSELSILVIALSILLLFVKTQIVPALKWMIYGHLFYCPFLFLLFFLGFKIFLIHASTIYFGMITFVTRAYIMALPNEFETKITSNTISKICICYALAQMFLVFPVGYLMEGIHPMGMFGYLFIFPIVMKLSFDRCLIRMKKEFEENESIIELLEK